MKENDWSEEQLRADRVIAKITEKITVLGDKVELAKTEVVNIRKHFWDEISINLSSPDDIVETHASVKQQAEILSEQERRYHYSAAKWSTLTRMVQSPYFGRVDFTEEGLQETDRIYLGISSFVDEDDDTFLVYDWRAPISSLYYDHVPGPVDYHAPFGDVMGTMSLKRQFVIHDQRILLMFDTGVTIGDELLMQVLSQHANAQMKSIVATIQTEQNRIIRNDRSRLLIVQGAAGSGKTSAALQRIAYLLYKHRDTLSSEQMVLFSPNPLFNSYVSKVLPELGEENMQQTTFQEYVEHRLGREFALEDPFTQMESILTLQSAPGYAARISGIHYKSSVAFLNAIRSYAKWLETEGMFFMPVLFADRIIITADIIRERFYSFGTSMRLFNRIELVRDWLLKQLVAFENTELQADWVEEEIGLLEAEDYHDALQQLSRIQGEKRVNFDDFAKEKEVLSQRVLQVRLEPLRAWIRQFQFVDVHSLYKQLFADHGLFIKIAGGAGAPEYWPEICRQSIAKLERFELGYEDASPFLYLKEAVQGLHVNTSVRHVIVDEVQDYSPFQLAFLKRLFPRCKMTLLGDLNQAIYPHVSVLEEFKAQSELYGFEQPEVIRLTRSYRSTREIVEFTRGMAPGGEAIVPFHRSGTKPRITAVTDHDQRIGRIADDIQSLQDDGYESIAVICKTANESADAYAGLSACLPLSLITKYTPTFAKETLVIPSYLAKGVEFDAVIIYDGSRDQYRRESERKLFYMVCTRAMHVLHIYTLGEPSPFITAQQADTYSHESARM